jgi:hypothetical protein
MSDEIDVPASAWEIKALFPTRPGDDIIAEIKAYVKHSVRRTSGAATPTALRPKMPRSSTWTKSIYPRPTAATSTGINGHLARCALQGIPNSTRQE